MMLTVALALCGSARAGGGGLYFDTLAGAGWSDATGPLIRGTASGFATGVYLGDYRGTFRYGRYWRVGAWFRYNDLFLDRDVLVASTVTPGLEVARGVDLLNIGVFWSVGAGAAMVDAQLDEPVMWGGTVRGSVGALRNFSAGFAGSLRLEGGAQWVDGDVSLAGGFAFGLLFRVPIVKTGWEDEREDSAADVNFADLVPPPEPPAQP